MNSLAKKRVLHVITDLGDGGAQSILHSICEADQDFEHLVVSMRGQGKYGGILEQIGIRVECLNMSKLKPPFTSAFKLYSIFKSFEPDVVQTWMYHANLFGGIVARLAGHRRISLGIHHATLSRNEMRLSTLIVARAGAVFSRIVPTTTILCAEAAVAHHTAIGYDRSSMVVVPNGFDLQRFRPDAQDRHAFRQEMQVDDATILIGCIARVHPAKDHTTFLDAIKVFVQTHRDIVFVLVGTQTNEPALAAEIQKRGLEDWVRTLGSRSDVPRILAGLDIHVLSSVTEAFGNVLCEAMASGTFCVSTDVGDARSILAGLGWIVPAGDPVALSQAMDAACQAVRSPEAEEVSRQLRQSIEERFTVNQMVAGYQAAWLGSDD